MIRILFSLIAICTIHPFVASYSVPSLSGPLANNLAPNAASAMLNSHQLGLLRLVKRNDIPDPPTDIDEAIEQFRSLTKEDKQITATDIFEELQEVFKATESEMRLTSVLLRNAKYKPLSKEVESAVTGHRETMEGVNNLLKRFADEVRDDFPILSNRMSELSSQYEAALSLDF